jgi:hypothetical protein
MVILNKNKLLYYKQKVSGAGIVYKEISGNGIFKDSLKTLGKYVLFGLKNIWKNALKPKAITLAMLSASSFANIIAFGFNEFFHIFFKSSNTYFSMFLVNHKYYNTLHE